MIFAQGQLPYLSHGLHTVSGFESIVKYAVHLNGGTNLDDVLSSTKRAENVARVAHVESVLGDLVVCQVSHISHTLIQTVIQAHIYYSLSANWTRQTRHILASVFPVPQCYYAPERMRLLYKSRLEAAELWDVAGIEEEEQRERELFSFHRPAKKHKKTEEKAKAKTNLARKNVSPLCEYLLWVIILRVGCFRSRTRLALSWTYMLDC